MPDFDAIRAGLGLVPKQPSLSETIKSTPDYSPDEHAQDLSMGKKLGVPADVVKTNRKQAQIDARLADTPESKIKETAPTLYGKIQENPDFAILSKDDLEALRQVEDTTRNPNAVVNAFHGYAQRGATLLGNTFGGANEFFKDVGESLADSPTEAVIGADGKLRLVTPNQVKQHYAETGKAYSQESLAGKISNAVTGVDLKYQPNPGWDLGKKDLAAGNYLSALGHFMSWGIETGAVSTPDMAYMVANMPGYLVSRGEEIARDRATADGRTELTQQDRTIGAAGAVAVTLFEKIGLDKLIKIGKGGEGILSGIVHGMAAEGFTELPQEVIEYLTTTLGTKQGATFWGAVERGLQGFVGGATFGGAVGGSTGGVNALSDQVRKRRAASKIDALKKSALEASKAEDTAAQFKNLGQKVKQSKLFGRNRDMLAELINQSADSNEVYIDSQGLSSALENMPAADAEAILGELRIDNQSQDVALTQSDAVVTIGDLMRLADNPNFDTIMEHVKSDPFGVTQSEGRQFKEKQQAEFQAKAEEIIAEAAPDDKRIVEAEQVRSKVESDLVKAGYKKEDAAAQALLHRNFALTMAEWTGHDVNTVYGDLQTRRRKGMASAQDVNIRGPVIQAAGTDRRVQTVEVPTNQRTAERRVDTARRSKIAAMSVEDQVNMIYKHELTGLNNRRAFEEDVSKSPVVASIDADSLKTVNDNISPKAGDDMLKHIADVLDQVLPDQGYHISGDEFYVLGNDAAKIKAGLDEASAILAERGVSDTKGKLKGLSFSSGIADTKEAADLLMKQNKLDREAAGLRASRGVAPKGMELNQTLGQSVSLRKGTETLKRWGLPPGKKYLTREVAIALEARQSLKYGKIAVTDRSTKAQSRIAKWMVEEVLFELEHAADSGAGWYSEKWQRALDVFGEVYPELKTDQKARDMFTLLVAFTSDGQPVSNNFGYASKMYSDYRDTGKIDEAFTGGGDRNKSIVANIKRVNKLLDQFDDTADIHKFLLKEFTVKELNAMARAEGTEFKSGYLVDMKLPRSAYLLGPKLGAFYANLMGSHGYLTMDLWWSRSFNRYRGNLTKGVTDSSMVRYRRLLAEAGVDVFDLSNEDLVLSTITYERTYRNKGYDDGTEIEVAANTIYKNAYVNLQDTPKNASDRSFMVETVGRAQKMLKRRGHTMSIADMQAVLWYYEKRLYGELGARQSADISYEEAAKAVVHKVKPTNPVEVPGPDGQVFEVEGDQGLNLEVAPDPNDVALTNAFAGLSDQNKLEATAEVAEAVVRPVAAQLGFPKVDIEYTNGGYLDQVNPSLVIRSPGASVQDLTDLGHVLGDVFSQDSVVVYDESNTDPETAVNHVILEPSRELTLEEQRKLYEHLREHAQGVGGFTWRNGDVVIGDHDEIGANFGPAIESALEALDLDVTFKLNEKAFASNLEYINNGKSDKTEIETGQDILRRRSGDNTAKLDPFKQTAQSTLQARLQTTYGQSPTVETLPDSLNPFGLKLDKDGMVPLTHWSPVADLTEVSPEAAGTGVDRTRRRSNKDAPKFAYFGAPGYRLESSVGSTAKGRYFTKVDPRTLYDIRSDPAGLYDQVKAENPDAYQYQIDALYQQAIIDAGYKGHWFDQGNNGTVVAMYEAVPVQKARSLKTKHKAKHAQVAGFDQAGNAWENTTQKMRQDGELRRGEITLGADKAVVDLFEGADMSTFLHESAHFFLHRMIIFSEQSPRVKAEMQKLLDWWGIDHVSQITEEHHELFARGFEKYMAEGKAPTKELRTVFQKFRDWIMRTYESLDELNVNLSDEVRGVFGKLVRSDIEFNQVEAELNDEPIFKEPTASGMTPKEYEAYKRAVQDSRDISQASLDKELLADEMKLRTREFNQRVAKLTADQIDELSVSKEFRAREFLQHGTGYDFEPFKLNEAEVKAMGDEIWKLMPKGKRSVTATDGVPLAVAADLLGFETSEELVNSLAYLKDLKAEAQARARQIATDELGFSPKDPASIHQAAVDAIMTRSKADVLFMELKALDRLSGGKGIPRKVVKQTAQRLVAGMKVQDLKPGKYLAATIRFAKSSAAAAKAGNMEKAAADKRAQLLNHTMYIQVRDARAASDSMRRYFRKFNRKGVQKNIDGEYLDQIFSLMEAYEFRKISAKERAHRKALADFVQEQMAAGEEVLVPPSAIEQASKTAYQDLTVRRMRELQDWVKNLEHLGRLKSKLISAKELRDFQDAKGELQASLLKHNKASEILPERRKDLLSKIKRGNSRFFSGLINMEFMTMKLDGDKRGVLYHMLWKPISDAQDTLALRKEKSGMDIADLMAVAGITARSLAKKTHIDSIDEALSKEEMISIALNMGNEGGRQRLLAAPHSNKHRVNWTEDQYMDIINHLSKQEMNFVQDVWDYLDSEFWGEIAQLQKDLTGVAPEKVVPVEVETKHGKFRGGYYPLKYDTATSEQAYKYEEKANVQDMFGGSWSRAATRHGHTETRLKELNRTVRLDLGVLDQHISEVLLDITHRKPVMDAVKLTNDPEVSMVLKQTAGLEAYREIGPWLQWVAGSYKNVSRTGLESFIRRLRVGASVVGIGFRLSTALVNFTGIFPALTEVRNPAVIMKAMTKITAHPIESWKFITERSDMMKLRSKVFNREAAEQLSMPDASTLGVPLGVWYSLIAKVDQVVTMTTWTAAYEKGMQDFNNDEAAAVDYADSVVRTTQSSSRAADLSAVQRPNSELLKMMTIFYSYFNMIYNRFGIVGRKLKRGEVVSATGDIIALLILPALLGELIAGRGPGDDEDKFTWASKAMITYGTATMPLVRDLVAASVSGYSYQISPIQGFGQNAVKMIDAMQEAATGKGKLAAIRKPGITALGYLAHLPSGQINKVLDYAAHPDPNATVPEDIWYALMGKPRK